MSNPFDPNPHSAAGDGAAAPARRETVARPLEERERLGPYRLIKELGRGGQGVVYLAEDERLKRPVALKALPGLGPDASLRMMRFRREAEVASKLDHPGICGVLDAGIAEGIPYIAMRYVRGESLAARIARAKSQTREDAKASGSFLFIDFEDSSVQDPPDRDRDGSGKPSSTPDSGTSKNDLPQVLRIIERAARAIHSAHESGIIHRDIKPANIMLDEEHNPVILDFGLARDDSDDDSPSITQTGDIFGTPAYMSPEQISGQRIRLDGRTDVYSLGATLFECLTLCRPFEAPTREALYQAILTKDPLDIRKLCRWVPGDLKVVVETALEKDRNRRYSSAKAFADDLAAVREHRPIAARPIGPAGRAIRFAKRRPMAAALLLTLAIGVPLVAALAGYIYAHRDQIEAQRLLEMRQREEALVADGFYAMFHDEPETALEKFAAAAKIFHDSEAAAGGCAMIYRSQKRLEPALAALDRASASSSGIRRLRAGLLRDLQRCEEAQDLEKELSERPVDAFDAFILGQEAMGRGHESGVSGTRYAAAFEEASTYFLHAIACASRPNIAYYVAYAHARYHLADRPDDDPLVEAILVHWPENPWSWHWAGLASSDIERSLRRLERSEEIDPNFKRRGQRAFVLWGAGRYEEASAIASATMDRHGDDSMLSIVVAESMIDEGKAEEAVRIMERRLEHHPGDGRACLAIARALARLQRNEEAGEHVKEGLSRLPKDFRAMRSAAQIYLNMDEHDKALQCLADALAIVPGDRASRGLLANVHLAGGRTKDAQEVLEGLLRDGEELAAAEWSNLSIVRGLSGDRAGGLDAAERAAELEPERASHYVNIALSNLALGNRDAAAGAARKAESLDPELPEVLGLLGNLAGMEGRHEDAIQYLERSIESRPNGAALANLGTTLIHIGRGEEGMERLERAVAMGEHRALYPYALELGKAGRIDECMQAYRDLIAIDPGHAEAHCNLADWCRRQGDLESAVSLIRSGHALGRKRKSWPYPSERWLSDILAQRGIQIMAEDPEEAVRLWREAIDAYPDNHLPHLFIAVVQLAESSPKALRDPAEALFRTQIANRLTKRSQPTHLDMLAKALEANGYLDGALKCTKEAMALMDGKDAGPVIYEELSRREARLRQSIGETSR